MSKVKTALYLLTVIGMLTGCTVSYSNPPGGTTSAASTQPHAASSGPEQTMNAIRAAFFTQTAQAKQQSGGTPAPGITNTPGFATVGPTAGGSTALPSQTLPAASTQVVTLQPTSAPVIPSPTPGGPPATYKLHEGETPWCLARRFNVDPSELLAFNDLTGETNFPVNLTIKIPTSGNPYPGQRWLHAHTPGMTFYVLSDQPNVYAVACYFGDVEPYTIIIANNLKDPYSVTAGQQLRIP